MYPSDFFPFAYTEAAVNDWLIELTRLKLNKTGAYLHRFLERLYLYPPQSEIYLSLLHNLHPIIIDYSEQLERWLSTEQQIKASHARKVAELSYQLLRSTALNYGQAIASTHLEDTLQASLIYKTLDLAGLCLRKQAKLSISPSSAIWQLMSDLYQRAKHLDLLDRPMKHPDASLGCIATVLQRNLLFAVGNPFHFAKHRVDNLWLFANQYAELLLLSAEPACFTWTPSLPEAPRPYAVGKCQTQFAIHMSCTALMPVLGADQQALLELEELNYLRQRFSSYATLMESSQPSTAKPCQLITDYQTLLYTLKQYNLLRNIHRVSVAHSSLQKASRAFQLQPLDIYASRLPTTATLNSSDSWNAMLHGTRVSNYCVLMTPIVFIQPEQLCLLVDTKEILRLGIVRQIKTHSHHQAFQVLVELFSGTLESVSLSFKQETQSGVVMLAANGDLELILPLAKHKAGDTFTIHNLSRRGRYTLGHLLECTHHCMHFRISALEGASQV